MHAHEAMVALGVVAWQADVLVHVEGDDISEGECSCLDELDEMFVGGDGRGSGGETKDKLSGRGGCEFVDAMRDVVANVLSNGDGIVSDDEACVYMSSSSYEEAVQD